MSNHSDGPASPATTTAAEAPATDDVTGVRAVHPPNRNGYAKVVGRLADLSGDSPAGYIPRKRTALLTRDAEEMLRDADAQQLGARGLALAKHGSKPAWRTFLYEHFGLKYGLVLVFDAQAMRVE
jgi:hypothetical protein